MCRINYQAMRRVFFFGTRHYAWMAKTDLKPYADFKETLTSGKKSGNFKMAVREIEEFVAGEDSVESEVLRYLQLAASVIRLIAVRRVHELSKITIC